MHVWNSKYKIMSLGAYAFMLVKLCALLCGALRVGDTTQHAQIMPFQVIIAGSRDFQDYELLRERCDHLLSGKTDVVVISGCARGADSLGERFALARGHGLLRMPANWNAHGKRAGYVRNNAMLERADALIAFWDGKSRGTEHMIRIARGKHIAVRVVRIQ